MFEHYRRSLDAAGLKVTSANSLICPLCWKEVSESELSKEHIVPEAVGGRVKILVCTNCNSDLGSKLDSHLAARQSVADVFAGKKPFRTRIAAGGEQISANCFWTERGKHFVVIRKASSPKALSRMRMGLESGTISNLEVGMEYGFNLLKSQAALLKSAYLILFKCYGYEYSRHDVVQKIRQVLSAPFQHRRTIESLVVELKSFIPPYEYQHFVIPGKIGAVEFFLVVIRLQRVTTTYHGVFLPVPISGCNEFFETMNEFAKTERTLSFSIPKDIVFC